MQHGGAAIHIDGWIDKRSVVVVDNCSHKNELHSCSDRSGKANFYDDPIAVTGMGCRFPGGSENPSAFWDLLAKGQDGIVDVPSDRWDIRKHYDPDPAKPGKMYVRRGGFLQNPIDQFDAMFFGISPREATCLDPQQRVLLEVAWEAMEDAGLDTYQLAGSDTGVYVGAFMLDNQITQMSPANRNGIGPHTALGSTMTILSNRLSFVFDFRGPSVSMDTACSSSLVAMHYACQGLWRDECSLALVGGVNIMHRPENPIAMCKGQFLSSDGRCKSFDERADGYGRGEGAGVIVLKRFSAAMQDGDHVYAVIRGTGVNQDGHTSAITVPNPDAQSSLIRKVCHQAQVDPQQICYFEAHGTGTPVGDPIEAQALGQAVGKGRDPNNPCIVGSVKANIGHLEAASGVAGTIKACLSLQHKQIPPIANLKTPNPKIPFEQLGLKLPRTLQPMPNGHGPRIVGVNSFGYGGTNAHILLQEAPEVTNPRSQAHETNHRPFFLPLSARSGQALADLAQAYVQLLQNPDSPSLSSICYSAARRRGHHAQRLAVTAQNAQDMAQQLQAFVNHGQGEHLATETALSPDQARPVFVMTGMGPQWWAMGRQLFECEPVFRHVVQACDDIFKRLAGWSIQEAMLADEADSKMADTVVAQPANFVLQAALTELWQSIGVEPAAVVGHSVGEVTAAYVCGVLSLEDALLVSFHRSRIQKKAAGKGSMLAVGTTQEHVQDLLVPYEGRVSIAAINSPSAVTLAGETEALEQIAAQVEAAGLFNRFLKVQVPYHSPAMDPLLDDIRQSLSTLKTQSPNRPLYSTVTGQRVEVASYDAAYWCENVRQPVQFTKAFNQLCDDGYQTFLEIGPHPVLSTSIKQCLAHRKATGTVVTSLRRKEPEQQTFFDALATLYTLGYPVKWDVLYPEGGQYTKLPSYPWQRQAYWAESDEATLDRLGQMTHPLLGDRQSTPNPCWEQSVNSQMIPYLQDHRVQGLTVLPGAGYVEAGLAICQKQENAQAMSLEDLRFEKAFIIDEGDEPILRCSYDPSSRHYQVHSRTRDDRSNWSLHAKGQLAKGHLGQPKPVDLDQLRVSLSEELDGAAHYEQMSGRGLEYGPVFQGMHRLWRNTHEVLAEIHDTSAQADNDEPYMLHPALLDACFQALLTTLDADDTNTYVPVRIGRVNWYNSPKGPFWCHGRLTQRLDRSIEGDLTLLDGQGNVLVELHGVRAQALAQQARHQNDDIRQWLHMFNWEKSQLDAPATTHGTWMLWMDQTGVAPQLAKQLLDAGADRVICVEPGTLFAQDGPDQYRLRRDSKEDLQQLFEAVNVDQCTAIVYLWGLDAPMQDHDATGTADVVGGLNLIQAMIDRAESKAPRLVVVTRGAQHLAEDLIGPTLVQAPLLGLVRVAINEYAEFSYQLVDLDPQVDNVSMLTQELLARSPEEEVAIRGHDRFVPRFLQDPPEFILDCDKQDEAVPAAQDEAFVLNLPTEDLADSVLFTQAARLAPDEGQVEIRIDAVAISDKDRVLATQLQPSEAGRWSVMASGVVEQVGRQVNDFQVGDSIVVCLPGGVRRFATVDTSDILVLPQMEHLSPEENAGLLSTLAPTYFGLTQLTSLQSSQSVLIHVASGGIGLGAIQMAVRSGASVFATASSLIHQDELRAMGVEHVFDPNQIDWADRILSVTQGQGVDVVLNTSERPVDAKDASVLADFGWLIHVTSSTGSQDDPQLVLPADRNLNFTAIDMDQMMVERPDRFRTLLRSAWQHHQANQLPPVPVMTIPAVKINEAFDPARATEHLHPMVVAMRDGQDLTLRPNTPAEPLFKSDATYLITGGFGGFGMAVAQWMAQQGAGHLVLVGRRGAGSPEAQAAVEQLQNLGATVKPIAADITEPDQVERLINQIKATMPPLRGILHAAAVLDDGPIHYLDSQRFETVMKPKALGAWHLHQYSLDCPLDYFVLFSSIASQIGSPGQATYVAANTYLDALAQSRRAQSRPAISINWGALAEVGMAARHTEVKAYFDRVGIKSLSPSQAVEALGQMLRANPVLMSVAAMDWYRWGQFNPAWAKSPRFAHLIANSSEGQQMTASDELRRQLAATEPEARQAILVDLLVQQVAKTLRLPPDKVDPGHPLTSLGVDSLMSMELQTAIAVNFGVEVSTLELMKGNNITQLADHVLMKLEANQTIESSSDIPDAASTSCAGAEKGVACCNDPIAAAEKSEQSIAKPLQEPTDFVGPGFDELEHMTDDQLDALLEKVKAN